MGRLKRIERRISPRAYWRLRDTLLRAESDGFGPTEATAMAMTAIGIGPNTWPPEPQETVLIVDDRLTGSVYPFMDEPAFQN